MPGIVGRDHTPHSTCLKPPVPKTHAAYHHCGITGNPPETFQQQCKRLGKRPSLSQSPRHTSLCKHSERESHNSSGSDTANSHTGKSQTFPPRLPPTGAAPVDEAIRRDNGSSPEKKCDASRAQLVTTHFTFNCVTRLLIKLVI